MPSRRVLVRVRDRAQRSHARARVRRAPGAGQSARGQHRGDQRGYERGYALAPPASARGGPAAAKLAERERAAEPGRSAIRASIPHVVRNSCSGHGGETEPRQVLLHA